MVYIRGDANASHYWPFVLDKYGKTYVTSTENTEWHPASGFKISGAKIYRMEYGLNSELRQKLAPYKNELPPLFKLPLITDVTHLYKPDSTYTISFPNANNLEPVYLALADHDKWKPVDVSVDKQTITFQNVAGGVVAVLGCWNDNIFTPISDPFEIDSKTGKIRYLIASEKMRETTLFCKFPLSEANGDVVDRIIGGVIEGDNHADFSNPTIIHRITSRPKRKLTTVILDRPTEAFRYVRYKGAPGSYSNIAELMLFSSTADSTALSGTSFGTPGCMEGDNSHDYTKVFNGDLYTSFNYHKPSDGWAAIDFGRKRQIAQIIYSPRNRDNFIKEGDVYELFYFHDKQWKSLTRKIAQSDSISYIAPTGALLFLKNHTNGHDERIFEYDYDNEIQIFW